MKTKDTELSGRIDTLNTTDDALKAKDTELSGRIDTLNTTDDDVKTRLDALETATLPPKCVPPGGKYLSLIHI